MSQGFMEYVVNHSHDYTKKSPCTNQVNDEPAVVPRSLKNGESAVVESAKLGSGLVTTNHVKARSNSAPEVARLEKEYVAVSEYDGCKKLTKEEEEVCRRQASELLINVFNKELEVYDESITTRSKIFKITTLNQLKTLLNFTYNDYLNPLPSSDEMFPYLHGLNNVRQCSFFIDKLDYDQPSMNVPLPFEKEYSEIPKLSFFNLLTIDCCEDGDWNSGEDRVKLTNSISFDSLLTQRREHGSVDTIDETNDDHIEYIEYEALDSINKIDRYQFQLNNRNFDHQIKLLAPLSHFLVYDSDLKHDDSATSSTAETLYHLVNPERGQYIYVVDTKLLKNFGKSEELKSFVEPSGDLINQPISSINNNPFHCKLLKMEQNMIWKTHSVREVFPRTYIGNLIDFSYLTNSNLKRNNYHAGHDFKLYINCHENAQFPNIRILEELLKSIDNGKLKNREILLEFPSAGSINCDTITWNETLSFINTLKVIYKYVHVLKHDVFIFCFDGFTGLSLLTLALGSLFDGDFFEDVVVNIFKRSQIKLYFFKNDVIFLKRFEKFLYWFKLKNLNDDSLSKNLVDDLKYEEIDSLYYKLISNKLNNSKESTCIGHAGDWFDWECDNNFPAQIYPNLYLGSLCHASSSTILNTYGITRVISMGEKPIWFNELNVVFEAELTGETCKKVIKPIYSFYNGSSQGDIYEVTLGNDLTKADCHPPKNLPQLRKIIYIHNVKDDGRDSLMPLLTGCPERIQRKVLISPSDQEESLIHCKIGVSRSATLVMASVMKYLKKDILQAYMFVRIRRFNIIVQPNLRVFYELFLYDEYLRRKKNRDLKRRYCWASLCHEIHKLNSHYIH